MNATNTFRDRLPLPRAPGAARRAFTLVELVVVIVILAILSSLLLSGLAGARQRAKIDKTRSTIRKLHEIVIPLYETYVEKRIAPAMWTDGTPISRKTPQSPGNTFRLIGTSVAGYQLCAKRYFAAADMPDLWDDAWDRLLNPTAFDPETYVSWQGPWQIDNFYDPPRYAPNPRFQAVGGKLFGAAPDQATIAKAMAYESAECLQMIVVRGGRAADAVEQFRVDEIGDVDKDGAPEFLDGWGRPISFIRWPVGFVSVLQGSQAGLQPDPMDPLGVSVSIDGQTDRAVIPLIYSGGPNNSLDADTTPPDPSAGTYGLVSTREALSGAYGQSLLATWQQCGWLNAASPNGLVNSATGNGVGLTTTRWPAAGPWAGAIKNSPAAAREASDNITNHDLVTK